MIKLASQNKQVYFNIQTDGKLLEFANSLPNFSTWVKEKIREELTKQEVERQVNQKLVEINDQSSVVEKKKPLKWNFKK